MSKIRVTLEFDSRWFDGVTAAQACRRLQALVHLFPEPDDIPDPQSGEVRNTAGEVLYSWKVTEHS